MAALSVTDARQHLAHRVPFEGVGLLGWHRDADLATPRHIDLPWRRLDLDDPIANPNPQRHVGSQPRTLADRLRHHQASGSIDGNLDTIFHAIDYTILRACNHRMPVSRDVWGMGARPPVQMRCAPNTGYH